MIKIGKINVSIIDKSDVIGDSYLNLKISGPNINYIIILTCKNVK